MTENTPEIGAGGEDTDGQIPVPVWNRQVTKEEAEAAIREAVRRHRS